MAIMKIYFSMFWTTDHWGTVPRHSSEEKIIFGKCFIIFMNSMGKGD